MSQLRQVARAEPRDQHHVVDLPRQRHRVDHLGERRRVEHHVVRQALGVLEQGLGGRQREHLGQPVVGAVDEQRRTGCRRTAAPARARPRATTLPSSTSPMPTRARTPSASPTVGRRKSASIRITRLPASASDEARLIAVVVLPSEGDGPVTRTERLLPSSRRCAAEHRAQRAVGLERRRGQLARRQRAPLALTRAEAEAALAERERRRPALLGHAGEDRKAVELAQLLLAAQARVERVHREGAADAEHEPGEDAGDDRHAPASARTATTERRRACPRSSSGRRTARCSGARRSGPPARPTVFSPLSSACRSWSRSPAICFSASVLITFERCSTTAVGEAVREVAGEIGRVRRRGDGDDVALCDRFRRDLRAQRVGALVEPEVGLARPRRRCGWSPGAQRSPRRASGRSTRGSAGGCSGPCRPGSQV